MANGEARFKLVIEMTEKFKPNAGELNRVMVHKQRKGERTLAGVYSRLFGKDKGETELIEPLCRRTVVMKPDWAYK